MLKHYFSLLAASCTLLPAAGHADVSPRKAIQKNYNRISAAFRAADPAVMDAMLAPDATLTTPDKKTWPRERILADFTRQSKMMKDATWKRKITALAVHGDEADATVAGKFHGSFAGQGGNKHVFDMRSETVDTWVKIGADWKLKHADTRKLDATVDGKPPSAGMGTH